MKKIYDYVDSICIALIFVAVIMLFVFRMVTVSGSSMENTLMDGDRIIVTKLYKNLIKGDVVVVDKNNGLGKPLVKRVIATGGDKIKIDFSTGSVYVNGEILEEEYIKEPMYQYEGEAYETTVPQGYLFVMGDNRNVSQDSRSDAVGTINEKSILGKVVFRIMPLSEMGKV